MSDAETVREALRWASRFRINTYAVEALDRLVAERDEAQRERDSAKAWLASSDGSARHENEMRRAAEAEAARYKRALEKIANGEYMEYAEKVAADALAAASVGGDEMTVSRLDEIRVGDVWRSRDRRDNGLCVTVLRVTPTRVMIQRFRRSWVRIDRFHSEYERASVGETGE